MSPARLRIISPAAAAAADDAPWIYLGKDADLRLRLERRRGRRSLPLGRLLHEEARRLRAPFLDLVAELGLAQPDPGAWWAGTLAWKDWTASDLFLLACYQAVCQRLAAQESPMGVPELAVVVEDPWLHRQLRLSLGAAAGVSFSRCPALALRRLKCAAWGAARRARWVARMIASRLRLSWHRRRWPRPPANAVLLYSYCVQSTFEGTDGWRDFYLPGLEAELREAGCAVVRCVCADATGLERELAARSGVAVPILLHASARGFLRALAALPPRARGASALEGSPLGLLLEREWWHDLSRSGRGTFLLHLDACRRLLAAAPWRAVVMPWEGQPQERLLALAAAERGVRSVGCQHSTVSLLQLPYFLGRDEARRAPLPDLILVSGRRPLKLLSEGGIPRERLLLAGNRRFAGLESLARGPQVARWVGGDVLVMLPIGSWYTRQLLAALARGFPEGGRGFEFVLRPHPAEPRTADLSPLRARVDPGPMERSLASCGCVIFNATSAGLEPWLLGHPVLRYRADGLLDVDPLELLEDGELPTAGDGDIAERLLALRQGPPPLPAERLAAALSDLFGPVDRAAWAGAILGGRT